MRPKNIFKHEHLLMRMSHNEFQIFTSIWTIVDVVIPNRSYIWQLNYRYHNRWLLLFMSWIFYHKIY